MDIIQFVDILNSEKPMIKFDLSDYSQDLPYFVANSPFNKIHETILHDNSIDCHITVMGNGTLHIDNTLPECKNTPSSFETLKEKSLRIIKDAKVTIPSIIIKSPSKKMVNTLNAHGMITKMDGDLWEIDLSKISVEEFKYIPVSYDTLFRLEIERKRLTTHKRVINYVRKRELEPKSAEKELKSDEREKALCYNSNGILGGVFTNEKIVTNNVIDIVVEDYMKIQKVSDVIMSLENERYKPVGDAIFIKEKYQELEELKMQRDLAEVVKLDMERVSDKLNQLNKSLIKIKYSLMLSHDRQRIDIVVNNCRCLLKIERNG